MDSTLETVGSDLDAACDKIVAVRESLQALDGAGPEVAALIARLERMEAELERIEAGIAVREGLVTKDL